MASGEIAARWPLQFGWALSGGKSRGRHLRPDDLERLAALRRIGGAHFGAGPMFEHRFGGGRGRKRRGDVRLAVLILLAEEPRNGYQLMQTIEERSGGRWRPSPGSVYPTLAQLEDEGLIRATEREGTRLFEITDTGRAYLAARGEQAPPWEAGDDPEARSAIELRSLLMQVAKAASEVVQVGDEQQTARAWQVLTDARRSLYRILAEDTDD
jgi:DNA-binding PadR family transcriptional regulator